MMKKFFRNSLFNIKYLQQKKTFTSGITTDSFMNGVSAVYIEQMFKLWNDDKKSVHSSWDSYFTNLQNGVDFAKAYQGPPNLVGCKYNLN